MLSPSAARMGCVKTTLRHIGRRYSNTAAVRRRETLLWQHTNSRLSYVRTALASDGRRWKSTMAAYDDSSDEEDNSNRSHGHSEAVKARSGSFSHEEAWMINLGRDDNNEWLLGTRNVDEWFTGLKPSICPGT